MNRIAAISAFAFMLTSCGGSNGGVTTPRVPSASPAPKSGSVALSITVPTLSRQSVTRRPAYVSVYTGSIAVTPQNGPRQVFAIAPDASGCNSTPPLTCTFSVSAPAGQNIVLTISTHVGASGGGAPLSIATITTSVVPGQSNPITATLNGVVAGLSAGLTPNLVTPGPSTEVPLIVNALDIAGRTIIGPGVYVDASGNPVTLTLSNADPSNSTTLSQTTITQPTSGIVVRYNGSAAFSKATITVSAPNLQSYSVLLTTKAQTGTVTEFSLPSTDDDTSGITVGPDGALWFTEDYAHQIGRITTSGVVTEFPLPAGRFPISIAAGPDGNLWFTELYGSKIGRITPNGIVTEFPISEYNGYPVSITAGPDGNLWFTQSQANTIGRITPSGAITEFPIPTAHGSPTGITAGPDGNVWFTEIAVSKIGRITPSGAVTEFPAGNGPYGITAGPDGNLWFTENYASFATIGRITPSGDVTEFTSTAQFDPTGGITAGPDGNLWFTEQQHIGRMTPTGTFTFFRIAPTSTSKNITAGPDGNLWYSMSSYSDRKIGRIAP